MTTTTRISNLLLSATIVLFGHGAVKAQYDSKNLTPEFAGTAEQQFTCDKLRLYPILANDVFREANKDVGRTVPMNKALADGRLQIKEHAGGATVNTLQAHNTSNDTIYLMQGEIVTGGKQDRMLAQDLILVPGATMDIGAFCVEHGRWSENGDGQQFTGTFGVISQDVRKAAAVSKEQTAVWDKVRHNVVATGSKAPTGSYSSLKGAKEFTVERDAYRSKLKGLPASSKKVVGVIAVSGNRVIGCDVFATHAMFTEAYQQLIDAYIADALNNGAVVTMTDKELKSYFETLFAEEDQLEKKTNDNGYLYKEGGKTYRISTF